MSQRSKLFWRCRRGMREMDILLLHYLNHCYSSASNKEQQAFEALLEEHDVDILAWITNIRPADQQYLSLIQFIRQTAHSLQLNIHKSIV